MLILAIYIIIQNNLANIKHKKQIALANKETLVVAGELVTKLGLKDIN
jgi:1-deoxy-D-xylulose 5-phosphate reductoisomerase